MVEHSGEIDEIPTLKWPRRFPVPRDFAGAKAVAHRRGKILARARWGRKDSYPAHLPL